MEALINNTLILERVEYKGSFFKAFIISNVKNGTKMPEEIKVHKILICSNGPISRQMAIVALCSYFNHEHINKYQWAKELLSGTDTIDGLLETLKAEERMREMDSLLYHEVSRISKDDVIIL